MARLPRVSIRSTRGTAANYNPRHLHNIFAHEIPIADAIDDPDAKLALTAFANLRGRLTKSEVHPLHRRGEDSLLGKRQGQVILGESIVCFLRPNYSHLVNSRKR